MSISAFGVEHPESFSKKGPIGAGLYRLGERSAKKSNMVRAGAARGQKEYQTGNRSDLSRLKVQQGGKPRGRAGQALASRSSNFRSGFQRQVGRSNSQGAYGDAAPPVPKFLR